MCVCWGGGGGALWIVILNLFHLHVFPVSGQYTMAMFLVMSNVVQWRHGTLENPL